MGFWSRNFIKKRIKNIKNKIIAQQPSNIWKLKKYFLRGKLKVKYMK